MMNRSALVESGPMNGYPWNSVLDLPGSHVLIHELGIDVERVVTAGGALWIGELDQADLRVRVSENPPRLGYLVDVHDGLADRSRRLVLAQYEADEHEGSSRNQGEAERVPTVVGTVAGRPAAGSFHRGGFGACRVSPSPESVPVEAVREHGFAPRYIRTYTPGRMVVPRTRE